MNYMKRIKRMKFNIFVINLDGSESRLESIKSQLDKIGQSFERVSAIRGSLLSEDEKKQVYSIESNKKNYYKLLSDGEIGCSLSHISCWRKIIDDNLDYALILEDDAIITSDLIKYINELKKISPDSWDYIKLSHGRKVKKSRDTMKLDNGLTLNTCLKLPSTTTGQFVSLTGAKKLLKHSLPISRPIDIDLQYWYEKDITPLVAIPFPIENGDFGSDINNLSGDRRDINKNRALKIKLKLISLFNILYNRKNLTLPTRKKNG